MKLLKQLLCKHAYFEHSNKKILVCPKCRKVISVKEQRLHWFVVLMIFVVSTLITFALLLMQGCEKEKMKACWKCEIVTEYHDPLYPNLVKVTGLFAFCDTLPQPKIDSFIEINTYSDSTMTQTCNCWYEDEQNHR